MRLLRDTFEVAFHSLVKFTLIFINQLARLKEEDFFEFSFFFIEGKTLFSNLLTSHLELY